MKGDWTMNDHLYILWTNPDEITAEKMVFMYARNSILQQWWSEVTVIIWGAAAKMVAKSKNIQAEIAILKNIGVHISACVACAEQLGVKENLQNLGIEVKPWGALLTEILKENKKLLTI
jgi:hypothetical protein